MRKIWTYSLLAAFAVVVFGLAPSTDAFADHKNVKKIAIHVDTNDPKRMNLALNNAQNLYSYYKSKGIKTEIRIVAYGPGLHMLRDDTSPVKARIAQMALAQEGLTFAACGNTRRKMAKKEGKEPPIVSEAKMVPSGVVELTELQEHGWIYLKP